MALGGARCAPLGEAPAAGAARCTLIHAHASVLRELYQRLIEHVAPYFTQRVMYEGDVELIKDANGITLRTCSGVDVSGEAVINNRKGKTIPSYELAVKGMVV